MLIFARAARFFSVIISNYTATIVLQNNLIKSYKPKSHSDVFLEIRAYRSIAKFCYAKNLPRDIVQQKGGGRLGQDSFANANVIRGLGLLTCPSKMADMAIANRLSGDLKMRSERIWQPVIFYPDYARSRNYPEGIGIDYSMVRSKLAPARQNDSRLEHKTAQNDRYDGNRNTETNKYRNKIDFIDDTGLKILSDKIYSIIERNIKIERERRGLPG
jgi:hypothetical protein